jgi:hypothetical protein
VDAIETQADMELVGQSIDARDLINVVSDIEPDILVVAALSAAPARSWDELPYFSRPLKVLAIVDNERCGLLYELRPCRALLGELSPASLVEAIRVSAVSGAA